MTMSMKSSQPKVHIESSPTAQVVEPICEKDISKKDSKVQPNENYSGFAQRLLQTPGRLKRLISRNFSPPTTPNKSSSQPTSLSRDMRRPGKVVLNPNSPSFECDAFKTPNAGDFHEEEISHLLDISYNEDENDTIVEVEQGHQRSVDLEEESALRRSERFKSCDSPNPDTITSEKQVEKEQGKPKEKKKSKAGAKKDKPKAPTMGKKLTAHTNVPNTKQTETSEQAHLCSEGCIHQGKHVTEMIQCTVCMVYHHFDCIQENKKDISAIWCCNACRKTPKKVQDIWNEICSVKNKSVKETKPQSLNADAANELITSHRELCAIIRTLETELVQKFRGYHDENTQIKMETIAKQLTDKENETTKLKAENSSLKKENEKLLNKVKIGENKLEQAEKKNSDMQKEIEKLSSASLTIKAEQEKTKLEKQLKELETELSAKKKKYRLKMTELSNDFQIEISMSKSIRSSLHEEIANQFDLIEKQSKQLHALNDRLDKVKDDVITAKEQTISWQIQAQGMDGGESPSPWAKVPDSSRAPKDKKQNSNVTQNGNQGEETPEENTEKKLLILGSSQLKFLRPDKLIRDYKVTKQTTYTIKDAEVYLKNCKDTFDITILHLITNDVKKLSPQEIADGIEKLCDLIQSTGISKQVIVSSALPRIDERDRHLKAKATNSLVSLQVDGRENTVFCDHYNSFITADGERRRDLFMDSVHVNEDGTRLLAANLKYTLNPDLRPQRPYRKRGRRSP